MDSGKDESKDDDADSEICDHFIFLLLLVLWREIPFGFDYLER
jgi:hypothetical protein